MLGTLFKVLLLTLFVLAITGGLGLVIMAGVAGTHDVKPIPIPPGSSLAVIAQQWNYADAFRRPMEFNSYRDIHQVIDNVSVKGDGRSPHGDEVVYAGIAGMQYRWRTGSTATRSTRRWSPCTRFKSEGPYFPRCGGPSTVAPALLLDRLLAGRVDPGAGRVSSQPPRPGVSPVGHTLSLRFPYEKQFCFVPVAAAAGGAFPRPEQRHGLPGAPVGDGYESLSTSPGRTARSPRHHARATAHQRQPRHPGFWFPPVKFIPPGSLCAVWSALGIEKKLGFSESPLRLYEGTVYVGAMIDVSPDAPVDTVSIRAVVTYQACDNEKCLLPESLVVFLPLPISSPETAVDLANPDVFDAIDFSSLTTGDAATRRPRSARRSPPGSLQNAIARRGLWFGFVLVFLGGSRSTLTPCVYPMIPITVSYFGGQSRGRAPHGRHARASSTCSAWQPCIPALGLVARSPAVFGSALQNPIVLIVIALVMIALAMSMFGFYEIRIPNASPAWPEWRSRDASDRS
jgi:hypothetical protein